MRTVISSNGCRTDFADIQNKKECGGNRQWQNKSYLPEEKQEEFEAIAFSVFNCLESFLMMLEDGELYYQPEPIEEESDLDNQADEMAQYQELAKEVEDSEKEAREIAYDDTIHEYIDKRTEQLKEQATFEELVDNGAWYCSDITTPPSFVRDFPFLIFIARPY